LLFNWEAFEPEKGKYNNDYLEYYKGLVKKFEELQINVIVDFHQDGFSRNSLKGCGQGFPFWALPPGAKEYTPKNNKDCEAWYSYLIGRENNRNFNSFYQNINGVKDQYLKMMQTLAQTFKDSPNVI